MKRRGWARQHPARVVMLAAGSVGSLLLVASGLLAASGRATGATHPAAAVAVQQGIGAAALATAQVFGQTPPRTPERVTFVLRARRLGQLETSVEAGMPDGYLLWRACTGSARRGT